MTRNFSITLILLAAILFPSIAAAHGGVEKTTGKTSVYLTQSPISPLVGETVRFTFVLKQGINAPLRNLPVTLTLIDTYFGDESQDVVVLIEAKQTDANGAFQYDYAFNKENYFDINLAFIDPSDGSEQETGFLVQPRAVDAVQNIKTTFIVVAGAVGLALGMLAQRFWPWSKLMRKNA